MLHIAADGSGSFQTIQEALDSLPVNNTEEVVLFIHKGVYRERLTVQVPHVTMIGEGPDETVIDFDLSANMIMEDGTKRGTFRSWTCLIDTHDFKAQNLTFSNSAGKGSDVGQAVALYADGDRLVFDNCRLLGNQDTLFTGPLPPKEIVPNGFVGPKQYAPRINGRHYYRNCYIEGDIDFIFGSATAYFEGCTLFSKCQSGLCSGFVTAASTPEGQAYGYVMKNCRFESNCPPGCIYLGRPWRDFAKTVLIDCYMGNHICPEGFHDWNKPLARQNTYYAEYGSFGPGAENARRADWIHMMTEDEAGAYSRQAVLAGDDGWDPVL